MTKAKELFRSCDHFQRCILLALMAMVVLFGAMHLVFQCNKGVVYNEALLKKAVSGDCTTYTGKDLTITVRKEGDVTILEHASGGKTDTYTVEYPLSPIRTENGRSVDGIRILKNGSLFFEGGYDAGQELLPWYNADGSRDISITVIASTSTGEILGDAGFTKSNIMYFVNGPELTARGSLGLYLLCTLLALFVAVNTVKPELRFYLNHALSVRDPEPTEFYLTGQRIGDVLWTMMLWGFNLYAVTILP